MKPWLVTILIAVILSTVAVWWIVSTRPNSQGTVEDPYSRVGRIKRESEQSLERGYRFLISGDLTKAIFEFQDAIHLDSNNYRAYYNLGLTYRVGGDFARAEAAYRTSLDIAPRFQVAKNNLANVLLLRNQPEDALKCITEACTSYPDCTDFADTKIDVLLALKRYPDAVTEWRKWSLKNPDHYGIEQKRALMDSLGGKP